MLKRYRILIVASDDSDEQALSGKRGAFTATDKFIIDDVLHKWYESPDYTGFQMLPSQLPPHHDLYEYELAGCGIRPTDTFEIRLREKCMEFSPEILIVHLGSGFAGWDGRSINGIVTISSLCRLKNDFPLLRIGLQYEPRCAAAVLKLHYLGLEDDLLETCDVIAYGSEETRKQIIDEVLNRESQEIGEEAERLIEQTLNDEIFDYGDEMKMIIRQFFYKS